MHYTLSFALLHIFTNFYVHISMGCGFI